MCIKQTHLIRPCVVIRINFLLTQQYINAWLPLLLSLFPFAAESESTAEPGAIQDILTCGSCQKTFALGDIVKFIQHKVLQCNKENYGQCFPQGKYHTSFSFTSIFLSHEKPEQLIVNSSGIDFNHYNFDFSSSKGGTTGDRDSEDGRPLSLVNRRPSISAPISTRKPSSSSSRVHTPPLASPGFLGGDGTSSTPKRLTPDGKHQHIDIFSLLHSSTLSKCMETKRIFPFYFVQTHRRQWKREWEFRIKAIGTEFAR